MIKTILGAIVALGLLAIPASAGCEQQFDDISKAISGHLNLAEGHRAAMMRVALSSYDRCMSGDSKGSDGVRDLLMMQLRENLGGK